MPGTLEFAIHTLVDKRLDMSIFEGKYRNDETGRAAYHPKILLKIVLPAYSRGLISSRKIEPACRRLDFRVARPPQPRFPPWPDALFPGANLSPPKSRDMGARLSALLLTKVLDSTLSRGKELLEISLPCA